MHLAVLANNVEFVKSVVKSRRMSTFRLFGSAVTIPL